MIYFRYTVSAFNKTDHHDIIEIYNHVKGNCGLFKYLSVIVKSDAYSYWIS
jgi:hypothetical protein